MNLLDRSFRQNLNILIASLSLAVLVLVGGFSISGCSQEVDAGEAVPALDAVNVYVQDISEEKRVLPIRTSGRLASKAEIKLSFKIGGFIDRLYVDEGRAVNSGTRLARLNLAEINAQVQQASSALEKATRDRDRAEGLYRDSVVTLEQVQDARTGVEIAEANLNIASFNRTHAEIFAPAGGRILKRTAEAGELVGAGQPIFVFGADREGWVVRVGLADRDIVNVAVGDSARLSFDAYPGTSFSGWITEVADAADVMSSTFEVEIALDDPSRKLKSGFIARVDIFPSRAEAHYFLPIEALVEGNGEEGLVYVYDEAEEQVKKIPVRIARILDREIAITGGLAGYSKVVTEGGGFLKGEGPVNIKTQPE